MATRKITPNGNRGLQTFYSRLLGKPTGTTTLSQRAECWTKAFAERHAVGMSISDYCLHNRIAYPTYIYWQDKLVHKRPTPKQIEAPKPAEESPIKSESLTLITSSVRRGVEIEINGTTVRIYHSHDLELLANTFQLLFSMGIANGQILTIRNFTQGESCTIS